MRPIAGTADVWRITDEALDDLPLARRISSLRPCGRDIRRDWRQFQALNNWPTISPIL